jgi:hypothetical protein
LTFSRSSKLKVRHNSSTFHSFLQFSLSINICNALFTSNFRARRNRNYTLSAHSWDMYQCYIICPVDVSSILELLTQFIQFCLLIETQIPQMSNLAILENAIPWSLIGIPYRRLSPLFTEHQIQFINKRHESYRHLSLGVFMLYIATLLFLFQLSLHCPNSCFDGCFKGPREYNLFSSWGLGLSPFLPNILITTRGYSSPSPHLTLDLKASTEPRCVISTIL